MGSLSLFFALFASVVSTTVGLLDPSGNEHKGSVDVAVVGGGVAGTYSAWRLLSSNHLQSDRVMLFERTDRIGGRFDSPSIGCGNTEGMSSAEKKRLPRCELGGMRIRSQDRLMLGVAAELGLELGTFHMNKDANTTGVGDEPSNPVWLRGLSMTRFAANFSASSGDWLRPTGNGKLSGGLPYSVQDLPRSAWRASCIVAEGSLSCPAVEEEEEVAFNPCNVSNGHRYMNRPVSPSMLPVWQLSSFAERQLNGESEEYMNYREAMTGYGGELGAGASINLGVGHHGGPELAPLPQTEFYKRPLLGMQEFPVALHRNYTALGGRSLMNYEIVQVQRVAGESHHPYILTFAKTTTSPCTGITSRTNKTMTIRAGRLILALPKAPLGSIEFLGSLPDSSSTLHSQVSDLRDAIAGAPYMKLFASFPSRFWQSVGVGGETDFNVGRFTASSRVRQLFAWYPGTQARDADGQYQEVPEQCKRISGERMGVMQMYATGDPSNSWSGLVKDGDQLRCKITNVSKCEECFSPEKDFFVTPTNPASNHVPQALLETWRTEVASMFGVNVSEIPEPTELKYKIWHAQNPQTQTDAVHSWRPGFQWWKLYDQVLEVGGKHSNLHIVGEAFSFNWGWGEGALETAEYMLQEHMGLALPSWLDTSSYCLAMPYYPLERRNRHPM